MDESHYIGEYVDSYGVWNLYYYIARYSNNRIALELEHKYVEDGLENFEPYAMVTINLPDASIPENLFSDSCGTDEHQEHAFINGDLDERFKQWLRDKNVISYPLRTVKYNYGTYELCEILVK